MAAQTWQDRAGKQPGGDDTWIQYWPHGNQKHLAHGHDGVCVGAATACDDSGNVIGRYEFEKSNLKRAAARQETPARNR